MDKYKKEINGGQAFMILNIVYDLDPSGYIFGLSGAFKGEEYPLYHVPGEKCVIGRKEGCDIQIIDKKISRVHCTIRMLSTGEYEVTDYSSNGTFYNNQRLKRKEPCRLPAGAILVLGDTKNILQLREESWLKTIPKEQKLEYLFGKGRKSEVIIKVDENKRNQKKKKIGIIAAVLLGVYVLVMLLLLFLFGGSSGNQAKRKTVKKETVKEETEVQAQERERKHISTSKEELQNNTVTYDDGDYVYTPSDDHIFFDDTDHMIYYDNLITVYLDEKISDKEKEKIKKKIDGESIGSDLSGTLNVLDIVVASSDYTELQQKAEELTKMDGVQYAMISFPVMPEEDTADYWDGDGDLKNEASPSGADWWAEAIGAYSAWDFERYCNPIVVGVMDSGFETGHIDFQRNGHSVLTVMNDNSVEEHGTHVAGLIAAQDNDMGSRGVIPSADVVCIDWAQEEDGTEVNLLTPTGVSQGFKQMIEYAEREQLPIVINNSWGNVRKLRELLARYIAPNLAGQSKDFNELYGDIYTFYSSVCATQIMNELLQNSTVDFLIVQSSGNGYGNGFTAYNVKRAGWFGGIDKELRKQCSMLSYDLIKSHIMIVGAVGEKKKDGKYKLRFNSNYGDNVDIVAPGEHIYSTVLNNSFGYKDGTSMAAPIVSGAAAYIWSLNPDMSAAEVKQRLIDTAEVAVKHAKEDKRSEYPMLNLGSAATSTIMETVNGETEDSASELENFARNYQYLCEKSEKYDGYIYYPSSDGTIQGRSDLDPQPLAYDIEDYDGDGENELLIVNLEPYTDLQSSTIRLQMYEVENGTVRLAAEHLCQATYSMITGAEVFQQGDTRVFKYQQNNQWILAAEQSVKSRFFDGHGDRLYMEVQYDGNQFQVKGVAEGETGSPDEELIKEDVRQEYAALGLNVDVDQIFSRKKHIYDYIDNPVSLAKTEYYYDYSKVEQDTWCKFGYITVSVQ